MMLRLVAIFLLLLSTAAGSVNFEGHHHFRSSELSRLGGQATSLAELTAAIAAAYVESGFLEATVRAQLDDDTTMVIVEGHRYSLKDVPISGLDSGIVNFLDLSKEAALTSELIAQIANGAATAYADRGYPFASVQLITLEVVDGRARLEFTAVLGPRTQVGEVGFPGITATRPTLLLRRTGLNADSLYRERDVEIARLTLRKVDFIASNAPPRVRHNVGSNEADIEFVVVEKRNLEFEGVATLDPDNSLAGRLHLGVLNVLGYGERVAWRWERRNKLSKELELSASVPYVGGSAFDVGISARQSDRDSSFVNAQIGTNVGYHLGLDWTFGGNFSWQKITPDEGRTTPSARILEASLNSAFDSREDRDPQTPGVRILSEFASSYRKSFATDQDVATGYSRRILLDGTAWLNLNRSWMIAQRVLSFQIDSDFDPIPDEQFLEIGGGGSLRGYREKTFLAREGILSSTELQYFPAAEVILRIFCDNAYLRTQTDQLGLTGFGLGSSLRTSLGWFRLDLTLGESKQFDKILVHFGFDSAL